MEIESAVGAPSTNDHTGSHRNYKNAIYDDDDDSEASGGGDGGGTSRSSVFLLRILVGAPRFLPPRQ